MEREWDELPRPALVNIFSRTSIDDRMRTIPLVCRSWAQTSRHPACWASMVSLSLSHHASSSSSSSSSSSLEDAFVKHPYPRDVYFVDPFDGRCSFNHPDSGIALLHALIQRAGGGAATTSLYFFPFLTSVDQPPNDDALLRLIARRCPNLKHLSFHGSHRASEQAVLEVISSCRQLELVDFSDSPYFNPLILKEMSLCCPHLKGVRRNGPIEPLVASTLLPSFRRLMFLNVSGSPILDKDLLNIVTACRGLQYLDVRLCPRLLYYMYIIKSALPRISQIMYD